MENLEAVTFVISALKKKKKHKLSDDVLKALGLDFDIDFLITDKDLNKELKTIDTFIPNDIVGSVSDTDCINLIMDLCLSNDIITSDLVESTAHANSVRKDQLDHAFYNITLALVNEGQVDEDQQVIYSKDTYPSEDNPPANITNEAKELWIDVVWPEHKNHIQEVGKNPKGQWEKSVYYLKQEGEQANISIYDIKQ